MTDDRRRALAGELADAWDTLLRADRDQVSLGLRQGARFRMSEAIALAIVELDPAHFHDPDPERLHLYAEAGLLDTPRAQLLTDAPQHNGHSPLAIVRGCPRCEWDLAMAARDRIGARP